MRERGVESWVLQMKPYVLVLTIVAKRSERNISDCLSGFGRKGYNPINQIVGYLLSGDPSYIPRYRDARNLIRRHERDEIMEVIVKDYLSNHGVNL